MTVTDKIQVLLDKASIRAATTRAESRLTNLTGGFDMKEDARQDSLDQLWELFTLVKEQAETEAKKDSVSLERLATLVRISSQAADNYRYHAGH